ncbi:MAG: hypothetical protein L0Y74_06125 [candidate division Zixibacteria bacterium]|nr:hypothetical protein [candidate division Zixibacteria bacterium]
MGRIATKIQLGLLTFLSVTQSAWAADSGSTFSGFSGIFGIAIIFLALCCFYLALKIYSYLKKGELAWSWQMVGLAFLFIGLAQMVEIATNSGWLALTPLAVHILRFLALVLMLLGLQRTKKILS